MKFIRVGAALAVAAGSAFAQNPAPTSGEAVAARSPGSAYRSAFDGYRRHAEQPVVPWRKANDTVGRIGGWKAYAQEAAADAQPPAPGAPGARGPNAAAVPGGHAGHAGHGSAGGGK